MNYTRLITLNGNLAKLAERLSLPVFRLFSPRQKEYLVKIFATAENPEVRLRVYELLKRLQSQKRGSFGFLLVLGWDREWTEKYSSLPDSSQNIFAENPVDLMTEDTEAILKKFMKIAEFDGAVLVGKRGKARVSGAYLENMQPKQVIEKMGKTRYSDLSSAFGFYKKVHTRHLAGIACSYLLKGSLVYVISEEDKSLRIFENGRIIYSPYRKEIEWNLEA